MITPGACGTCKLKRRFSIKRGTARGSMTLPSMLMALLLGLGKINIERY